MPSGGMDTVSPPGQVPDGKGPVVRNFIPSFPNKMVMRGPIRGSVVNADVKTAMGATKPLIPLGWVVHNDRVIISFTTAEGRVPWWKAPYWAFGGWFAGTEFTTPVSQVFINITTGEVENITSSQNAMVSSTYAKLEGFTYYTNAWEEGQGANDQNGAQQMTKRYIHKWDGTPGGTINLINAGPQNVLALKSYLNRIWALGGIEASLAGGVKWKVYPGTVEYTSGATFITVYGSKADLASFFDAVSMSIRVVGKGTTVSTIFASATELAKNKWKVPLIGTIAETFSGANKIEAATAGFEPNTLWFSDAGGPVGNEKKYWQDDVSGLINRIIVGDDDQRDFGVGLGVVGGTLIIFKRKSIWALYGTSPESFQVRNLTYEYGCIDPHSILESHYGVYFASQRGLMYYNGESFTQVDEDINNVTLPLMEEVAGSQKQQEEGNGFGRICVEDIGNGYLMMTIAKQARAGLGTIMNSFCGIMNYETHNWAEVTGGEGAFLGAGVPLFVTKVLNQPVIFDGARFTDIIELTNPDNPNHANIDKANGKSTAIPAKVVTDRIMLSSPGYVSQLHRLMQDYTWPVAENDTIGGEKLGWWFTMKNSDGTVVQEPVQFPGHGWAGLTKYLRGRRWENDDFNEVTDATIEIEWKNNGTDEPFGPELYDATLEFSITRQRRSM